MKMKSMTITLTLVAGIALLGACGKKDTPAGNNETKTATEKTTEAKTEKTVQAVTEQVTAKAAGTNTVTEASTEEPAVQIPNPFVEYDSVEEAGKHIDFTVSVPDEITGYPKKDISVMSDTMFQIVYSNNEKEVCIRKQAGDGDISGDYTEYTNEKSVEAEGITVRLRGDQTKYYNLTWTNEGYAYSVYADAGLSEDEAVKLAAQIK